MNITTMHHLLKQLDIMQSDKCKDCQHVSNHNRISIYNGAFCIRIYMKMNKSIFWLLYNFADNTYQNVTVNWNRPHPKFLQHFISLQPCCNSTDNASLDCTGVDQIDTNYLPTQQNLFMNGNHKTDFQQKFQQNFYQFIKCHWCFGKRQCMSTAQFVAISNDGALPFISTRVWCWTGLVLPCFF